MNKNKRPAVNSSKERAERGKKPYNPPRITKHPYVDALEKRVAFRFGAIATVVGILVVYCSSVVLVAAAQSRQKSRYGVANAYERTVNVTLDTVMWVHEQHKGKLTWAELFNEVCKRMNTKRTDPWQNPR